MIRFLLFGAFAAAMWASPDDSASTPRASHSRAVHARSGAPLRIVRADPGRTNPAQHEVRRQFQRENPCTPTGVRPGACPGYQIDHVIPLRCGGPDEVGNMQWQTTADARAKDKWERIGCEK